MNATELRDAQILRNTHVPGKKPLDLPTEMTDDECQIIYGSLLGDANIRWMKQYPTWNEYFREAHCLAQKDYIYWKAEKLARWFPSLRDCVINSFGKKRPFVYMRTKACPMFTIEGRRWYKTNIDGTFVMRKRGRFECRIKIIPKEVLEQLSGFGLAIWYLDDGSINQNNKGYPGPSRITISTEGYSCEEVDMTIDWLHKIWGVESKKVSKNPGKYGIRTTTQGTERFLEIVGPWIKKTPLCMHYKLGTGNANNGTITGAVAKNLGLIDGR